jgi:RNase P protein component
MLKLVSKNKRPTPKMRRRIQAAMRRAYAKAIEQNWDNVIIIGQGKQEGSWQYSPMLDHEVIGMIEQTKYLILESAKEY